MARAVMDSASTMRVDDEGAGPGDGVPALVGLIAYWKIAIGALAIGAFRSVLQNWLL
jgi:hypothetical protein